MRAYYNEIDRFCCDWIQNLMDGGHITPGKIDDRDIREVEPGGLAGYERVHSFAGISGWDLALDLAGWRGPVWTGSCPCQPFSIAGKGRGSQDERHLWPAFYDLIAECRPSVIFGEQIASKLGRTWLAAVRTDLEDLGYAVGSSDLCAAGVGAPHIRQRLWWVADADGRDACAEGLQRGGEQRQQPEDGGSGGGLGESDSAGRIARRSAAPPTRHGNSVEPAGRADIRLGDADEPGPQGRGLDVGEHADQWSPWAASEFIPCSDGKARPTQPGIHPLAHGIPGRVGRLRAYGNAIVPQVAAAFVRSFMEVRPCSA